MKKLTSIILLLLFAINSIIACSSPTPPSTPDDEEYQLKIGYLNGPTGMGMAKLINDNGGKEGNEKYSFTASTAELVGPSVISGAFDIACMPTNTAAMLYNNSKNIEILAINCLNSIYIITDQNTEINSFEDLEGKTIYTSKAGTPAPILKTLLEKYGINATVTSEYNGQVIAKPENLSAVITDGGASIVAAPEPIITAAILALKKDTSKDIEYSIDLDLGEVWNEKFDTEIAMGCIVANKNVINTHKDAVDNFLKEYMASIEFIANKENTDASAQYIVDAGIMAAVPAAKTALTNLNNGGNIDYIDGILMKETLIKIYKAFGMALIGGKLPEDDFYYEK